jgi:uroporphyrinogen decarboxylase
MIHDMCPHVKVYLHSHGQIMDLVPDLIECGVDILNPVLPLDHMDPVLLKQRHGRDLCFHGGIDIEHIVPFGTEAEVRDHVRRIMDILGEGGGYWFKLQVISPMIPPKNIIAAYEEAHEYA